MKELEMLGKVIDIAQMNDLNKSVNELRVNVQALNEEFKQFNAELQKSNTYFERMDKSSIAMGRLTLVVVVFTVVLCALGFYPILKEGIKVDLIAFLESFVVSAIMMLLVAILVKKSI